MKSPILSAEKAVLIIDYLKDNIPIQQRMIHLERDSLSNELIPVKLQFGEDHTLLFQVQLPKLAALTNKEISLLPTKKTPIFPVGGDPIIQNSLEKIPSIKMASSNLLDQSLSILLLLCGCFYLWKQINIYWQARSHTFQRKVNPVTADTTTLVEEESVRSMQPEFSMDEINWLVNLQQTVEQNMSNIHFDIGQLANDLAISTRHLNRRIRQYTGFSTNKYIQETRLITAKKLLDAQAYKSVKAVAYEVGYKDVKYFGQLYKKRFGRLPSTYFKKQQRQWQGSRVEFS